MTKVPDAVAQLNLAVGTDEDVILVSIEDDARRHYRLPEIAGCDVESFPSLYLASGTFKAGTVTAFGGRTSDNIARILWLPFDADLASYLSCEPADLHGEDDDAIASYITCQRQDIEAAFDAIGLPIHRLDYTGYGLAAYVRLTDRAGRSIDIVRQLHKAIIARINEIAHIPLLDPQVSDAGTRIMRVPGSLNRKGATPRVVRTLAVSDALPVGLDALQAAAAVTPSAPVREIRTQSLPSEIADEIVSALRPSWTEGSRHALALAIAGTLANAGIEKADTQRIIEALSSSDAEYRDRTRAVETTYARLQGGQTVQGFSGLRRLIPEPTLAFIDEKLRRVREATAPRIVIGQRDGGYEREEDADPAQSVSAASRGDVRISSEFTDAPEAAFYGWFGDYRNLMAPTTEASDNFHLGAGLTLAGSLIGRRVASVFASELIYTNMYTLLIGDSGSSRKDTAIKRSLRLPQLSGRPRERLDIMKPPFTVSHDVSSAEGLIEVVKEHPNTMLYLTEFTTLLENARRKGTRTIIDRMIHAWDTPDVLENNSKLNPNRAERPYLSMIAATQPARLADAITDEDIHSGFANRLFFCVGRGKEPMADPPPMNEEEAYILYRELMTIIADAYDDGQQISMARSAKALWDDWYYTITAESGRDEAHDAMRVRHQTIAMKIATIFAVSDGSPDIKVQHLEAAIVCVEWMWENTRRLMRTWGMGVDARIEESIVRVLRKYGPMKRRDLYHKTRNRKWTAKEFGSMLKAMLDNGTLERDATDVIQLGSSEND